MTRSKRVVIMGTCVACGRVVVLSKNGHPRKHAPHNRLQGKRRGEGVCDGTYMPAEPV
jgi:hypothetical protein